MNAGARSSSATTATSRSWSRVVGILLVLFAPIPPRLLDFLLIANFSFALLILLLTFYMAQAGRVLDLPVAAADRDAVPAVAQHRRDAADPVARPTPAR